MPNREVETLNVLIDDLVADFRYTMNFALSLIEELPPYFFFGKKERKDTVKGVKSINKKYFEEE